VTLKDIQKGIQEDVQKIREKENVKDVKEDDLNYFILKCKNCVTRKKSVACSELIRLERQDSW